jgi:F0F1-type ATP synthase delta subunit
MNSKQLIKVWTRVLIKEAKGKTAAEQKKIFVRLYEILKNKKKEYLFAKILERVVVALEKEMKFEIVLAHEQPIEAVNRLEERLGKLLCARGARVRTDPAIIGGFIAKSDQYLVDASVKGFLEQLKKIYQNQ